MVQSHWPENTRSNTPTYLPSDLHDRKHDTLNSSLPRLLSSPLSIPLDLTCDTTSPLRSTSRIRFGVLSGNVGLVDSGDLQADGIAPPCLPDRLMAFLTPSRASILLPAVLPLPLPPPPLPLTSAPPTSTPPAGCLDFAPAARLGVAPSSPTALLLSRGASRRLRPETFTAIAAASLSSSLLLQLPDCDLALRELDNAAAPPLTVALLSPAPSMPPGGGPPTAPTLSALTTPLKRC